MSVQPTPNELWGPPINKYLDEFEQRTLGSALAMNIPEVYPVNRTGFTPLSTIAHLFVTLENNHQLGHKPTEKALATPLAALRKYYKTNKKVYLLLLLGVFD